MSDHMNLTQASDWVQRFSKLAKAEGHVLDLACGSGRHGRLFLELGNKVDFIDKNISALEDLEHHPMARLIQMDLEDGKAWPFGQELYDVIVVTNYLYREHLESMILSLKTDGLLIYETFALGNEKFGKPSNPAFLLMPGELLELVSGKLQVIAYEHGQMGEKVIQHICAKRTANPDGYSMI